jgi:hypothetical protein
MVKVAGYSVIVDRKADPRPILFRVAEYIAQHSGRRRYHRAKQGAPEDSLLHGGGRIGNGSD